MNSETPLDECLTLGCDNSPANEGYCQECLDISPNLLDTEPTDSDESRTNDPATGVSSTPEPLIERGETAFVAAAEWFHAQLDREIPDHTDEGDHPDRPTTAREYFHEVRGWTDSTIDKALLGYAPATRTGLLDHLMREGYDREAILGTGLFTEDLRPLWQGRYVLPYFDEGGTPVYAISRATGDEGGGAVGYDGHPDDGMSGKYAKPAHTKDYADVEEPIFGLGSIEDGEPVLITEGIADTITAHQEGYACISPVTTRFKHDDREQLVAVLDGHDVPRAYVFGDAERPSSDLDEEDRLTIQQAGEGLRGALDTAAHLSRNGVETHVAELPRTGLDKVDLDGYLREWSTTLGPVLASAKPAREHPDHDPQDAAIEAARTARNRAVPDSDSETGDHSALFDLDLHEVAGVGSGYRGVNPLGHHGESENYAVTVGDGRDGVLYDHKHKVAYNALTYLLVETGERRADSPNGRLDNSEVFVAWRRAKDERAIPEDDSIPRRALRHVALSNGLCETDEIEDGWKLPAEAYNDALDMVEDEHGLDPGREHIGGGVSAAHESFEAEPCYAPAYNPVAVDTEQRRAQLEGERLDAWLDRDAGVLEVFGDDPGDGKTTSTSRGFAGRDLPFVMFLPSHENCREFELDDAKPDIDHHHKGAAQPRHDCCMDAKVAADTDETPMCPEHGHPAEWPRMCPIYHREQDDPIRQLYEALLPEVGVEGAHEILGLKDYDWHEERCAWQQSFDQLENAERVVTVNNYLTQKTVRGVGFSVLDDVQGIDSFTTERQFTVEDLTRAANRLDRLDRINGTPAALGEYARFARDLVDALTGGREEDTGAKIEALDPPAIPSVEWESQWLGEELAQAKLAYNEAVIRGMKKDEWDGEPLCIDTLLAAAVHAGLDHDAGMIAAALPTSLDNCPRCDAHLEYHGGAGNCPACGWSERSDPLVKPYDELARAQAWLDPEGEQHEYGQACVAFRALPLRPELPAPDDTLWLDATPTPELAALLFGIDTEDVVVTGDEPRALNAQVTQITNGQYHRGTIARGTREGEDHDEYGERLRERFQSLIDARGRTCDQVLVAGHKKNRHLFDLPDNAEWMHYHAGRGLDRSDYDAVVMIGAPHVREDALRRDAELLAQGRGDVRVGGREFGTRRNEQGDLDANPPIYRQYLYESDEDGQGRAAPTKGYSGLMGTLFRSSREDELLQIGHRVRPGQADSLKHIDLLTNVPTDLPVDQLTDLETLTEPLYRQADLPEGVMDMQAAALDALDRRDKGRGLIAGVRPSMLVKTDENGDLAMKAEGWQYLCRVYGIETRNGTTPSLSTIYDWLDRLDQLDLLRPEDYEQREGRTHSGSTATLNLALQYLSHNANFKVDVARRFRALVADGASAEVWLDLLSEAFDAGDGVSGGHPPPDPT